MYLPSQSTTFHLYKSIDQQYLISLLWLQCLIVYAHQLGVHIQVYTHTECTHVHTEGAHMLVSCLLTLSLVHEDFKEGNAALIL